MKITRSFKTTGLLVMLLFGSSWSMGADEGLLSRCEGTLVGTTTGLSDRTTDRVEGMVIEPPISFRIQRLKNMNSHQLTDRLQQLFAAVEQINGKIQNRNIQTTNYSGIQVIHSDGHPSQIFKTDVFTEVGATEVRDLLADLQITETMWRQFDEKTEVSLMGRQRLIYEYETVLGNILEGLNRPGENGFVLSSAIDLMLRKHQVYLGLHDQIKTAIFEDFTPISFHSDVGAVIPKNLPIQSLVGLEVQVEIVNDSETYTLESFRQYEQKFIAALEQRKQNILALEHSNPSASTSLQVIPLTGEFEAFNKTTAARAHSLIATASRTLELLPPRLGLFRGRIVSADGADLQIRDDSSGRIFAIHPNLGVAIKSIVIRSNEGN